MDVLRTLLSSYLFQDLTPAELEPLTAQLKVRDLAGGEYAFHAGDHATEVFIVQSGQMKDSLITTEGLEFVDEILTAGGVFGEPALFVPERTRMSDVSAMEPSRILELDRQVFIDFLFQRPAAMLRMLEGLAAGYRTRVETSAQMAFQEIRRRVISQLIELAASHGRPDGDFVEIELDLSQATLAGMVGATRENVNRALGPLLGAGEIRLGRRRLAVNVGALRKRLGTSESKLHRHNRADPAALL